MWHYSPLKFLRNELSKLELHRSSGRVSWLKAPGPWIDCDVGQKWNQHQGGGSERTLEILFFCEIAARRDRTTLGDHIKSLYEILDRSCVSKLLFPSQLVKGSGIIKDTLESFKCSQSTGRDPSLDFQVGFLGDKVELLSVSVSPKPALPVLLDGANGGFWLGGNWSDWDEENYQTVRWAVMSQGQNQTNKQTGPEGPFYIGRNCVTSNLTVVWQSLSDAFKTLLSAFQHMEIIKFKYCSTMTGEHLESCLRESAAVQSAAPVYTRQPWPLVKGHQGNEVMTTLLLDSYCAAWVDRTVPTQYIWAGM